MNYAELVAQFEDTVENEFTTELRETIVKNAEYRIYDFVQLPAATKEATTALTANSRFFTMPTDFRAVQSFAVVSSGTYYYLLPKQQDYVLEAYPSPTTTGRPVCYAILNGTQFILGPTPDSAYTTSLIYDYYPESIVTAGTTWLSTNFPLALLKACILEAGIVLKEEQDVIAVYDAELGKAMGLLKNYTDGRLQTDSYRSGSPKTKVS